MDSETDFERRSGEDRRTMADRRNGSESYDQDTVKEVAAHSVEIKHLLSDVEKLADAVDDMKRTLHDISATLSEAKGGWRTLLAIGGAIGTGAAVVPWAIEQLHR